MLLPALGREGERSSCYNLRRFTVFTEGGLLGNLKPYNAEGHSSIELVSTGHRHYRQRDVTLLYLDCAT